jgi:hypothetical protein
LTQFDNSEKFDNSGAAAADEGSIMVQPGKALAPPSKVRQSAFNPEKRLSGYSL